MKGLVGDRFCLFSLPFLPFPSHGLTRFSSSLSIYAFLAPCYQAGIRGERAFALPQGTRGRGRESTREPRKYHPLLLPCLLSVYQFSLSLTAQALAEEEYVVCHLTHFHTHFVDGFTSILVASH